MGRVPGTVVMTPEISFTPRATPFIDKEFNVEEKLSHIYYCPCSSQVSYFVDSYVKFKYSLIFLNTNLMPNLTNWSF